MKLIICTLLLAMSMLAQTTINGSRPILGNWDASGAITTKPMKMATSDPATCAVGEMLFRSDTGTLRKCGATNTWSDVGGSGESDTGYDLGDAAVIVLRNDFFSGSGSTSTPNAGDTNWYTGLIASATTSGTVGDENHPGVYTAINHATNANAGVVFNPGAPSFGYLHQDTINNRDWTYTAIVKLGSISNAKVWVGLGAVNATPDAARFVGFRYDTSASFTDDTKNSAAGSWVFQMCTASTTCGDSSGTRIILNVPPTTNWVKLTVTKASGTYTIATDGTTRATVCASGCDATATAQTGNGWPFVVLGFETGASVTHSLDYTYFRASGLTR